MVLCGTLSDMQITTDLGAGAVHLLPANMRAALMANAAATLAWRSIAPLARNEFVCWVTSAKKAETRQRRIAVMLDKLSRGERCPCCWTGCPHRSKTTH